MLAAKVDAPELLFMVEDAATMLSVDVGSEYAPLISPAILKLSSDWDKTVHDRKIERAMMLGKESPRAESKRTAR